MKMIRKVLINNRLIIELSFMSQRNSLATPMNKSDLQNNILLLNNSINNNITTPFSSKKKTNSNSKNNSTSSTHQNKEEKPEKENFLGVKKKQPYHKMFHSSKSYQNNSNNNNNNNINKSLKSIQTPNSKSDYIKESISKSKIILTEDRVRQDKLKDKTYVNDFVLSDK